MATVIKASGNPNVASAAEFAFEDLGDRRQGFLDDVRRQAVEILSGAEQEAIAIRRRAEDDGRSAALEVADEVLDKQVGQQLDSLTASIRQAIDELQDAKASWLSHWEKTAVRVAIAIASRVIRREVEHQPDVTLALVREALELAAGSAEIGLHMHPDDVASLGAHVEPLVGEFSRLGKTRIVADNTIEKGSCRLETQFGTVDQQFAAQLARIEEELA